MNPEVDRAGHWDEVYRTKDVTAVSWFQPRSEMSLTLLGAVAPCPVSVVDVGAGASPLAGELLAAGCSDVTVLDISDAALEQQRQHFAAAVVRPDFVVADVLAWRPDRRFDVWHDRAVFHFLVDPADQARYVEVAARSVAPGGVAVLGVFAADGPQQCSGLPTARWDAAALAERFAPAFVLERSERELHHTPGGGEQAFAWVVLRRR